MVTTQIFTKQGQKSVLRIYGNGEVLVEDICQYLSALEQAYNSLYVFDSLVQSLNPCNTKLSMKTDK